MIARLVVAVWLACLPITAAAQPVARAPAQKLVAQTMVTPLRVVDDVSATMAGLIVQDTTITGLKRGAMTLRSSNVKISGLRIEAAEKAGDPHNFNTGIAIDGAASNVSINDVVAIGFGQAAGAAPFANGDTTSAELTNSRITWRNITSINATDAAIDSKAANSTIYNLLSIGSRYGLKLWQAHDVRRVMIRDAEVCILLAPSETLKKQQVFRLVDIDLAGCRIGIQVQIRPGAIAPKVIVEGLRYRDVKKLLDVPAGVEVQGVAR